MNKSEDASSGFATVDAATLRAWLADGEAVLIDVRETHEYEYEHVPGALLLPMSFFEPEAFPALGDRRLVMLCAVGQRSAAVCKQLVRAGFANVVNLEGGLKAWKEAGLKTQGARFDTQDYSI